MQVILLVPVKMMELLSISNIKNTNDYTTEYDMLKPFLDTLASLFKEELDSIPIDSIESYLQACDTVETVGAEEWKRYIPIIRQMLSIQVASKSSIIDKKGAYLS